MRTVRSVRFEMCMSPHEAIEAGPQLDATAIRLALRVADTAEPPQH